MVRLLILADDLTGALDAGVQFAEKGDTVFVMPFCPESADGWEEADVLSVNCASRHIPAVQAYERVFNMTRMAEEMHIPYIYKKTDSGLRGNVGAELTALLEASGRKYLHFVPAWPRMGRVTINGIHFAGGKPLAESIFAEDPLDPVTKSSVRELIALQSDVHVSSVRDGEGGIIVHDCASEEQMRELAEELVLPGVSHILAGCSGFLEMFPQQSAGAAVRHSITAQLPLTVVSGSLNDKTRRQLYAAEAAGAQRMHVPTEKILNGGWTEEEMLDALSAETKELRIRLLDTADAPFAKGLQAAEKIAEALGKAAFLTVKNHLPGTLMIIGGDTLLAFVKQAGISRLEPVCETGAGGVLTRFAYMGEERYLITRSGGFGEEDELLKIRALLRKERTEE